jgi:outer membrane receptor protein involved in Fe transport
MSQNQVFADRDLLTVSNDVHKPKSGKSSKIFGGNNRSKHGTKNIPAIKHANTISSSCMSNSGISPKSRSLSTIVDGNNPESILSNNSNDSSNKMATTSMTTVNSIRQHFRSSPDTLSNVNHRATSGNNKQDRRKDIKLTNCHENDGIWTATGQFGRESRHSKRADITYDKKKFRFTQKDDQGNKHVYEMAIADVEGKRVFQLRRIETKNETTIIESMSRQERSCQIGSTLRCD